MRNRAESGQAIILMAFMMIGLLAIAGLAIDGGGYFYKLRDATNAVDAGIWAGAYAVCTDGDYDHAVRSAIGENHFYESDQYVHGINISTENILMQYGVPGRLIRVSMEVEKPAYFIQIVLDSPLLMTVGGVGQCQKAYLSANQSAVTGLSSTCQNAVDISGSGIVVSGDILSNETIKISTSSGQIMGDGYYLKSAETNENTSWFPSADNPSMATMPIIDDMPWEPEMFQPGGVYYQQALDDGMLTVIDASTGVYHPTETLEGLYVIYGNTDFRTVGRTISVGPKGVTIIALGGGSIVFNGENVDLAPYIDGLLLMSTKTTTCGNTAINFSSSGASWSGDLYAPNGGISVSDSNNSSFGSSIVGQTVTISSSNTIIDNQFESSETAPVVSLAE